MGIDRSAGGLVHELKRAKEHRDRYLGATYKEQIKRFYGPAYRSGFADAATTDFYNHGFAWISVFLPLLASGNPRVRGKTMRAGQAAAFSKALEFAVNRNFELTDIKRTIEQLATDWAFKYAVAMTMPIPVRGMKELEDPPHRPVSKRLSLEDYIWDALSKQHAECRLQGHRIIRDQDGLMEEAEENPERRWSKEAIMALSTNKAREQQRARQEADINRDEVELWELWLPEFVLDKAYDADGKEFKPEEDDGFFGTIFTVAEDVDSMFIREPRPFFGPRDGPYTFSSYLYVPDEVVGVAPLVASAVEVEEYQKTLAAATEAIRRYKRGFAINSSAGESWKQQIKDFEDLGVFVLDALEKLDDNLKPVEAGGLTQQHLVHLDTQRQLMEKGSGLTDAKQGLTSGSTATEASIAQMSSGQRMGYMTEKFLQSMVKPIAKKEAWYLAMHPQSRTPLGEHAEGMFLDPETGQPIEAPVLVGGAGHLDLLEANDFELQPISMRFTTEMLESERAASWEAFLFQTAPMIPQIPYIDWALVYARKAEQLGDPSLARTVDVPKAMQMGMMMMQMQVMQAQGGQGGGQPQQGAQGAPGGITQPRLGVDIEKPKAPALKASEKPTGFTANARPGNGGQTNKGPRLAGASSNTH